MEPVWLAIAYLLGLAARHIGLPPLVGFLVAGFVLHAVGIEANAVIDTVADAGVTLLLFTIGLKLRIDTLLKPQVWGVATLHMGATVALFFALLTGLAAAGLGVVAAMDYPALILVAFALSFSSTVFAVKVLEDKGEMASLHGRISIGVLIMQDIVAVVFLAFSAGKIPSPWALALLALIPLRPVLMGLMTRSGHGELLILYGLVLALGGAQLFELVHVKGDLGALILGLLLSKHAKSSELSKALLGFKDLFLVGFFLSIGLKGLPQLDAIGVAVILLLILPLKIALYFLLMTRFHLRARTSFLASMSLANYSEFGLIVAAIGVANGWLDAQWLGVIAIALSISFILASPLNAHAHALSDRLHDWLQGFETRQLLPEDQPVDPGDAQILVFGMGHIGTGAYDTMVERYGRVVLGLDYDPATVDAHRSAGRNVIRDDATDLDFWMKLRPGKVRLVMLSMSNHRENMIAVRELARIGYQGQIAAIARFPDEIAELEQAGVQAAFNVFAEAGAGFADHTCKRLVT
jgi:glutathione-regulated potassium-efflux system ancillary protein KefC